MVLSNHLTRYLVSGAPVEEGFVHFQFRIIRSTTWISSSFDALSGSAWGWIGGTEANLVLVGMTCPFYGGGIEEDPLGAGAKTTQSNATVSRLSPILITVEV